MKNIRLHARLGAYSRYVPNEVKLPEVSSADFGSFLGVGTSGGYELFNNTPENKIESLFGVYEDKPDASVNKKLIDTLF